ncbi:MAG TPA: NAD(P)/FAD-dependent oxidoreductase [Gaiellaceae bacterium]|jgi:mercuric reductase|nr:NAD(P)/FAD-dependent oxidoreductase [Gaiellaceae bacterium]
MNREHYDLIVIGAGSAARDGARKAATEYGARAALVEHRLWGGSCPNTACTPTKAYLVAAELAHRINTLAERIGIDVGPATVDLARVKARKDSLRKPQPQWVEDLRAAGFDTYEGTASFVDSQTIRVGDDELTAERMLVATGSRTAVPPIQGIEDVDWLDHVSALELTDLPTSLLVVGAGAVGLEFGQAYARFGSQVTLVDALDEIAPRSDPHSAMELRRALEDEGIPVILGSFVSRVERRNGRFVGTIVPREGGMEREVEFERLLLASGRRPNVEELNLEAAGVETYPGGIVVDDRMRTSVEGIWAAGDVNGHAQFTPVAQYQARIAVEDMYRPGEGPVVDYSVLPTAIFTDPELAGVGLTEIEAEERGYEAESVVHPLASVRRASYLDAKFGLYKLVFDRTTRRVLGLHVVAPGASDVVQGFAIGLRFGVTVDDLAAAHHVFPTIGEGVKAAAEQARATVPAV